MEKIVYLGGPIRDTTYGEATEWRVSAKQKLREWGITALDPMRNKEFLAQHKLLVEGLEKNNPLTMDEGIVGRDRFDVMRSGVLLFNFLGAKKLSGGSFSEYGWGDAWRKPIITVMEREGNPHDHPFIRGLTTYRVETLESGLEMARYAFGE